MRNYIESTAFEYQQEDFHHFRLMDVANQDKKNPISLNLKEIDEKVLNTFII